MEGIFSYSHFANFACLRQKIANSKATTSLSGSFSNVKNPTTQKNEQIQEFNAHEFRF